MFTPHSRMGALLCVRYGEWHRRWQYCAAVLQWVSWDLLVFSFPGLSFRNWYLWYIEGTRVQACNFFPVVKAKHIATSQRFQHSGVSSSQWTRHFRKREQHTTPLTGLLLHCCPHRTPVHPPLILHSGQTVLANVLPLQKTVFPWINMMFSKNKQTKKNLLFF